MNSRRTSQREMIRQDLLAGKVITPIDALEKYGSYRLAARIAELREEGMAITTYQDPKNNMYAQYALEGVNDNVAR